MMCHSRKNIHIQDHCQLISNIFGVLQIYYGGLLMFVSHVNHIDIQLFHFYVVLCVPGSLDCMLFVFVISVPCFFCSINVVVLTT